MRTAFIVVFLLLLGGPVGAVEPPSQVELPDPAIFLDADTISIAVVRARPEDTGFRSLLRTAWSSLQGSGQRQLSPLLTTLFRFLQGSRAEDPLTTFLPVQAVRVDRMGPDGTPHPTLAVSVSGWAGLQSLFYTGLVTRSDGTPYPAREIGGETVFLRDRWEDPAQAAILTRVRGTFLNFPTLDQAARVIPRLYESSPTRLDGRLVQAFSALDQDQDTYGVVVNRGRSLLNLLYWLNEYDMARIQRQVGAEQFEQIASHIRLLSWEGDLVSDDRMDFTARFETDSPEAREELKRVLLVARDVLARSGRAGDLQVNAFGNRVIAGFSMLGYRQAVLSYLNSTVR